MTDREKVIKGLEQCTKVPYVCDDDCPYYHTSLCREELKNDALVLLKEQEEQDEPTFEDWTKGEGR